MKKKQSYKLVLIEWIDSCGVSSDWEFIEDLEPLLPCICKSVGFLVDEQPTYITIVQNINEDQMVGRMTIPCCAILEKKELDYEII